MMVLILLNYYADSVCYFNGETRVLKRDPLASFSVQGKANRQERPTHLTWDDGFVSFEL